MIFRIVVAFAFFIYSLEAAEDEAKSFADISKKCGEVNGITNEEIQKLDASKPIFTVNDKIKCYFRCILIELNLMNLEGNLILQGVTNIKPEYRKYVVECLDTTGAESCDRAMNFENCIWTKKMADEGNS